MPAQTSQRYHCCFWVGRNNLNSGGSSSSEYSRSEKQILLMRQLACICTLSVSMQLVPQALLVKSDKLNWIWFQPQSSLMGIVQMKGLTLVVVWQLLALNLLLTFLSSRTCTSKVKYFLRFLMIITRNGSLIPRVSLGSAGQVMQLVETFVPIISRTEDWMSWSVSRLMWPLRIYLSQI